MGFVEEKIFVEKLDLTLTAKIWGTKNNTPILAIHGWLDNAATFDALAPFLKDHYLICLDMPGHGFSDHLPKAARYSPLDYVYYTATFINQMKWERCSIIGHSMGAAIASLLAGANNDLIEKLILIDNIGPLSLAPNELPLHFAKSLQEHLRPYSQNKKYFHTIEDAAKYRVAMSQIPITMKAAKMISQRGLIKAPQGYYWSSDRRLNSLSGMRMSEEQINSFLQRVQAQTCVILGKQSQVFAKSQIDARKANIRNLCEYEVEGLHHCHIDSAETVASIVNKFLLN